MTLFFIIIIGLISGYFYYQIKIQNKSAKSLVRRQFSSLAINDDELALNLFRLPKKEPEEIISLNEINQSQILIGDIVISTINSDIENGFTDQKETNIRELFHIEQIDKMVDDKVRRISLTLNTGEKEIYVICLYMRKGSDRISQRSYLEAIEIAIDWCWLFSNLLNSEQTGKRIFKPKITVEDIAKADHKTHDNTPLHAQAASIRPLISSTEPFSEKVPEQELLTQPPEKSESILLDQSVSTQEPIHYTDNNLGYDLDKILELKEQGFLTAEEYSEAKTTFLKIQNEEK